MIATFIKTERGSVLSDGKEYFPASKIAEMLNVTRAAVYKKADKEKWPEIRVPGKGARGGVMHYLVPRKMLTKYSSNQDHGDSERYPTSTATHLITGTKNSTKLTASSHSGNEIRVNNFVTVPKYDLPITSGERDMAIHSTQIVDHLAFKKEWLEEMAINNSCLALITVGDDSMEPTLKTNDLILTDVRRGELESNSIYVLQIKNELIVKRIQCKINGNIIVKSDNPNYEPEELNELAAQSLHVVGKVIWYGRRI